MLFYEKLGEINSLKKYITLSLSVQKQSYFIIQNDRLFTRLSVRLSLFVYMSDCLTICLSVRMSVCQSVCMSVCLSVNMSTTSVVFIAATYDRGLIFWYRFLSPILYIFLSFSLSVVQYKTLFFSPYILLLIFNSFNAYGCT